MVMFHAQIWQFRKSANISETAAHRAKISSISTLWVERECMCDHKYVRDNGYQVSQ